MKDYFIALVAVLILFALDETTVVVAQQSQQSNNISRNNSTQSSLNSTNVKLESDDNRIVITWLKSIETDADNIPPINVSKQEFWKFFDPLLELSANRTGN